MIGTQMLAKGHDFPRLTLVGVLGADNALYSAEFRATERLFALLEQVAGRAGRGALAGEVLVQTDFPDHPVFKSLVAHDYDRFAATLLAERRDPGPAALCASRAAQRGGEAQARARCIPRAGGDHGARARCPRRERHAKCFRRCQRHCRGARGWSARRYWRSPRTGARCRIFFRAGGKHWNASKRAACAGTWMSIRSASPDARRSCTTGTRYNP